MYTVKWNLQEFGREMNRYLKANDGALVDVVNKKAWWIAKHALDFTPRANKAQILADMGAKRTYRITKPAEPKSAGGRRRKIETKETQGIAGFGWARKPGRGGSTYGYYMGKGGQLREKQVKRALSTAVGPRTAKPYRARAKPVTFTNDTAVNIIQARRINKGEDPLPKKDAEREARTMINAKTRAVGTLRVGWHGVLRRLASVAKEQYGFNPSHITGGMRIVKGIGRANPANKHTLRNPVCRIEYVLNKDKMQGVHYSVEKAANMGISKERASMRAYAAKKLQEVANKHTGRVA